ncbi:xanthine phosphoribosyltransferase [Periweissella fabalis]|uniref:Xanthine phosphoribosyltransferase n=1 Tax=Periweissella fabalis TaxID=1070421 RepID=A0A7X6S3U1_9LACO|nr:xanthine phosphoribosyltransferase [Periweissella fabalis]MCM0598634.1 xanthine phosphoribosyltransferase [Periweissella fabalis]NKZ24287.1 xanthine phosphoribosyltransferase [Periweissella fabalis]
MEALKQKIIANGRVLPGNVLKVDSFINQQIDVELMTAIGQEFAKRFANQQIDRILTIESSGIAPAIMAAQAMKVPLVFARKRKSLTLSADIYATKLFSYTTQQYTDVMVDKRFIQPGENVLVIDDFLANGQAVEGLIDILEQAQATLAGVGIVIEKSFQPGRQTIEDKGFQVESLVKIASLSDNQVRFAD